MLSPWTAVSSAMTAKVGVAASDSKPVTLALVRLRPRAMSESTESIVWEIICISNVHCFNADRQVNLSKEPIVVGGAEGRQRPPVPRSSECPAFRRDHWEVGRPSVRMRCLPSHHCGQPGGESSHVSFRP